MQEVAAAVTIRRAHYLAGNGSFQLRPRHLERPKNFSLLTDPSLSVSLIFFGRLDLRKYERTEEMGFDRILLFIYIDLWRKN